MSNKIKDKQLPDYLDVSSDEDNVMQRKKMN